MSSLPRAAGDRLVFGSVPLSAFAAAEASRDRESRAARVFRVWPANFPGQGDHLGILLKTVNSDSSGLRSAGPEAPRGAEAAGFPWKALGDVRPHPAAQGAGRRARGPGGRRVGSDRREGKGGRGEALRPETLEMDANTTEGGA